MKRILQGLAATIAIAALTLSLARGVRADIPTVAYSFSQSAVGPGPVLNLKGQSTCAITVFSVGGGATIVPQVASDGIVNGTPQAPTVWTTATTIGGGSISTAPSTSVGNIAGTGITNFRFNITALTSGTVSGVIACGPALGTANVTVSGGVTISSPIPLPVTFSAPPYNGPTPPIPVTLPTCPGSPNAPCVQITGPVAVTGAFPTPQPVFTCPTVPTAPCVQITGAVTVTGFPATQNVAVVSPLPLPVAISSSVPIPVTIATLPPVTGAGGTFPVTGTFYQATQPVSIATMPPITGAGGTFPSTQSGTWTVQPGNTQNTTAWLTGGATAITTITSASSTSCTSISATATRVWFVLNSGPGTTVFPAFYNETGTSCALATAFLGDATTVTLGSGQIYSYSGGLPLAGLSRKLSGALTAGQQIIVGTGPQ